MAPKIRNIIIFVVIAAILVLIYIFFIKPSPNQGNLVSSTTTLPNVNGTPAPASATNAAPLNTQDFLTLLLNVKNIKLDDAIFADPAFGSLHDSSIVLVPDATTGRPNPFAQFGNDVAPAVPVTNTPTAPVSAIPITLPVTTSITPAVPPKAPVIPATPPATPTTGASKAPAIILPIKP